MDKLFKSTFVKHLSFILCFALASTFILPQYVSAAEVKVEIEKEVIDVEIPSLGSINIIEDEIQINESESLTLKVYDENGYLEKVVNELGYEFFFCYDEEGILISVLDNYETITELKYDDDYNLVGAEYHTYQLGKSEEGETTIYTENQDGEFAITAILGSAAATAAVKAVAATAAVVGAAYVGKKAGDAIVEARTKDKDFTPRKDSRKGLDDRQKTGARERNVGHKDGEEHSRVAKGRGGRGTSNRR